MYLLLFWLLSFFSFFLFLTFFHEFLAFSSVARQQHLLSSPTLIFLSLQISLTLYLSNYPNSPRSKYIPRHMLCLCSLSMQFYVITLDWLILRLYNLKLISISHTQTLLFRSICCLNHWSTHGWTLYEWLRDLAYLTFCWSRSEFEHGLKGWFLLDFWELGGRSWWVYLDNLLWSCC